MVKQVRNVASCFVALSLSIVACGDGDDEGNVGSGGSSGKGGSSGSTGKGGSAGSTGGSAGEDGTAGNGEGGTGVPSAGNGGSPDSGGSAGEGESGAAGSGGTAGEGESGAPGGGVGGEPSAGAGGDGASGEGAVAGGAGGEGGAPPIVPDVIDNPSFETTPDGVLLPPWTRTAAVEAHLAAATYSWSDSGGAQAGNGFLDLWLGTAYTVTVSQTVTPLPDGSYTLSIWQQGGAYLSQYVFVRGYDAANEAAELTAVTAASGPYVQLTIPNIPVTSGTLEIGVYSDGAADAWSHFDNVTLTLDPI